MAKTESYPGGLRGVEFRNKSLIFNDSGNFRTVMQDRRRLSSFLRLQDEATKNGFAEAEKIKIHRFERKSKFPAHASYYKVELPEGIYFVKRTPLDQVKNFGGGTMEALSSQDAVALLLKHDLKNVRVVNFKLGMVDRQKEMAYFVSEYDEVYTNTLDIHIEKLRSQISQAQTFGKALPEVREKIKDLNSRIHSINAMLRSEGYFDLKKGNMAYNETEDTIYLFDLNKKLPGQPSPTGSGMSSEEISASGDESEV